MISIHLINNEKITLSMISLFQNINVGSHVFVIFNRSKDYISDVSAYENVFSLSDFLNSSFRNQQFDNILIHSLDIKKVEFVEKYLNSNSRIIWLLWGGDIYNRPEFGNKLFRRNTLLTLLSSNIVKEIPKISFNWTRQYYGAFRKIKKFSKRINIIATTVYEDFLLANRILNIDAEFREFNFYFLPNKEEVLYNNKKSNEINLLIGNSGDPSNNHIDLIIDFYKNSLKKNIKFYFILSYGNKDYISQVVKFGKRKLKEKFLNIEEFMTFEDYSSLLSKIDIGIFGFRRQQGLGNIVQLLFLKKAVFLDLANPFYSYLIRNNIDVKSIDKLDLDNPKSYSVDYERNFELIKVLFSQERGEHLAIELLK